MRQNITPRFEKALDAAKNDAVMLGCGKVGVEHVFVALLNIKGFVIDIFVKASAPVDKIKEGIYKQIIPKRKRKISKDVIKYNSELEKTLDLAEKAAAGFGHKFLGTEHFALAVFQNIDNVPCQVMKKLGMIPENIKNVLNEELTSKTSAPAPQKVAVGGNNSKPETAESALKKYAVDLTERAANNQLDPVVGRSEEINRVISILARKKKNNPVLVGPAGVGKTAVAEGLAIRIVKKDVPESLLNKKIFSLDFGLMVAGTVYRGQFEERLKGVITEVRKNPDLIIFIDELHMLIGAGSGEGAMDAANLLKPALARGEFRCIGATTDDEYEYVEKDPALERRFQKVSVEEPDEDTTIEILKGAAKSYEAFHKVRYSEDAIQAAVYLSERFIKDRNQPDKSIDLLDEAGAVVKLRHKPSEERIKIENDLVKATQERQVAASMKSDNLKELEMIEGSLLFRAQKIDFNKTNGQLLVREKDIRSVVALWSSIPVEDLEATEKVELVNINKRLDKRVLFQPQATLAVSHCLKKYRTPLSNPDRPIGSFLFCGPTGVGKTLLAQEIAEIMFGSKEECLHLDMTEYADATAVTKLIGASAGYVGYEDGAKLIRFVRKNPYSVILFDEIEKAHEDVRQLLMQIAEDGRLTDNQGRTVSFKNTIIIATSNVGADSGKAMGFGTKENLATRAAENILEEIKKHFKKELLGRLNVVVFRSLDNVQAREVVKLEIEKLNERLKEASIVLAPEAVEFIIKSGFDEKFGARNIRKQIENQVENPLIDDFLLNKIPKNSVITYEVKDSKLQYSIEEKS